MPAVDLRISDDWRIGAFYDTGNNGNDLLSAPSQVFTLSDSQCADLELLVDARAALEAAKVKYESEIAEFRKSQTGIWLQELLVPTADNPPATVEARISETELNSFLSELRKCSKNPEQEVVTLAKAVPYGWNSLKLEAHWSIGPKVLDNFKDLGIRFASHINNVTTFTKGRGGYPPYHEKDTQKIDEWERSIRDVCFQEDKPLNAKRNGWLIPIHRRPGVTQEEHDAFMEEQMRYFSSKKDKQC